jgi:hypothetical protein
MKMESTPMIESKPIAGKSGKSGIQKSFMMTEYSRLSPVIETNNSGIDEDFFNYIQWTGLAKEPGFFILSSLSRYYYDSGDFSGLRTLINLKELNQINHLDSFLFTIYNRLSSGTYFLGCFSSNGKNEKGIADLNSSKFIKGSPGGNNLKKKRNFTRQEVTHILEGHGFKVIDLTEIKSITYFCSRIMKRSGE